MVSMVIGLLLRGRGLRHVLQLGSWWGERYYLMRDWNNLIEVGWLWVAWGRGVVLEMRHPFAL